ncbi:hypothetical protein PC129_g7651 [Phytophthora cactorum]|uniref:Reverse transcriptase domain-containing protein n=2 Tax=Phytophthora cactorum TaxID=29920 RepID=A0A8T1ICW9_9STRA|nr:hypothetical protein PC129_g7651 [Phytophthora cactorum]
MKPVLAVIPTDQAATTASPAIPCVVMSTVETSITSDSAAEVSVVTTKLLKQLSARGAWIAQQALTGTAGVTGIGDKPVPVKSKVKLDLRFSTPGGPLILQNVIYWVTDQPLPPGGGDYERELVRSILLEKVEEARRLGATPGFVAELRAILMELINVFRLVIGRDKPVDMPPKEVTLKPGVVPVRCRARKYSQAHREFLKRHIDALIAAGLCYRNPRSRWCSPPHVVNKPEAGAHRMTVDVRVPNECVEQIVWPMPVLEFVMAVWCQEIYFILTEEGVITPTRVLMGGTKSVAYVQPTVQEMFSEVFNKGLLIWIDDLLGYEKSDEGLLILLKKVLTICAEKGLKLNPKKCSFYLLEALWCGRIVSGEGVRHDPARLTALTNLPLPSTGQDLQ